MNVVIWSCDNSQNSTWSDVAFGYYDDPSDIDLDVELNVCSGEQYQIEIDGQVVLTAIRF